jgi:hypothetical protein
MITTENLAKLCISMTNCSQDAAQQIAEKFPSDVDTDLLSFFEIKIILLDIATKNNILLT